jgi:hypothetical protein
MLGASFMAVVAVVVAGNVGVSSCDVVSDRVMRGKLQDTRGNEMGQVGSWWW